MTRWLYRLFGYRKFQHCHTWRAVNRTPQQWVCECGAKVTLIREPRPSLTISGGMFSASDVVLVMAALQGDLQVGEPK